MSCSDQPTSLSRRAAIGLAAGAAVLPLLPRPARAQGLAEARAQGYLGERPDGLLGQVDPAAPAWALELMARINEERQARYAEVAAANNTSVAAVQVVAAEKIIEKLPAGSYYMDANGNWVQK